MANIYDVEGVDQFLPEPKKSLGSFLNDYATTAQEVSAPYVGMAGKYGFGDDPAKIQGLGSDVRHTTGSALGKFAIQDYLSQFGLQPSNPISNFIGNVGIMGSTAAQEIGDAVRGFRQAGLEGAINQPMEDVRANLRARDLRYGTPLEDIVNFAVASSPSAYMANPPAEPTISRFNAPGPFNYGTAQAAEVTPTRSLGDVVMEARTNEPMDIEDFLGTSTPQDLGFIGNAPTIQEAVAPIGITDRNRGQIDPFAAERARLVEAGIDPMSVGLDGGTGDPNRPTMADIAGMGDLGNPTGDPRVVSEEMGMVGGRPVSTGRPTMADIAGEINENLRDLGNPTGDPRIASEEQGLSGFPGLGQVDRGFQDVLDAREARRNEIAMQQNPDYGQFFRDAPVVDTKSGFGLGELLSLAGLISGSNLVKGAGMIANRDKIGRMATTARDKVSSGLGSLNRKMRGVNPDGTTRTQRQYEQARADRQLQGRIDNMLERKAKGKSYSEKNLQKAIEKQISGRADKTGKGKTSGFTNPGKNSYGPHKGSDSGGGGGGGKVVCTMMNERYGFGSFRNKIWMKFHESYGPEYQKGYHAIFLPLVKIAKGEGKINTAVRKVLEHMGRHVTADMFKIMKGKKRDPLGRIYRAIFEPTCRIIGKIKSALGRG